ncbi:uncharacterized protein CMU_008880 [Cryptosporidium muris RN66]|uniref:G-patch domain-containing protein n=1 Tax=Cryptosporidium muris (strain RN66) TaxID=441375 RepID=B6ADV5_CRYMR|nr:uncharacterized protein CMU_008880 [Cryptosporidium muris RN66]EEA06396.1 hypothetical protein, conserved [Cryptosporidium muris RN66]|eukprot:XP_002140745.1 hypothetical protein [Cryptosporidium muris RN66]
MRFIRKYGFLLILVCIYKLLETKCNSSNIREKPFNYGLKSTIKQSKYVNDTIPTEKRSNKIRKPSFKAQEVSIPVLKRTLESGTINEDDIVFSPLEDNVIDNFELTDNFVLKSQHMMDLDNDIYNLELEPTFGKFSKELVEEKQRPMIIHARFGEPVPQISEEELELYGSPNKDMILAMEIPTMKPQVQFKEILRLSNSRYKGLTPRHRTAQPNVNWCRAIGRMDPRNIEKATTIRRLMQSGWISILGGTGEGGAVSFRGESGQRGPIGWPIQNICEGIYLLETTYHGTGDCERILLDLLARYHGQWGLFLKIFRQRFRQVCQYVGYSIGEWELQNDRAYAPFGVFRSSRSKRGKYILTEERREMLNMLRNRGSICSQISEEDNHKAMLLKSTIDKFLPLKHINYRVVLSDYCEVVYAKRTIVECVEAILTLFKIKSTSNFDSTSRFNFARDIFSQACKKAGFISLNSQSEDMVSQSDKE